MWLVKRLSEGANSEAHLDGKISAGTVTSDGAITIIKAKDEKRSPEILAPYGYHAKVPQGEKAGMLNGFYIGVTTLEDKSLSAGEIKISSRGGAEIILKNTGEVFINGQRFAPKS